jgi:two-component system response regulator YesN
MLYRLMLVDDEPEIREGMKEIVDWAACGFKLVAEADNGLDALQLAEQTRPDLVITDVRMRFMDGLEMVERMRAFLPMAQFVVVSGYDEFEYTRKSIQIKISDYVLKPVSAAEFTQVLERAKRALDQEYARHNSVQVMNRIFADSLPILRQQLLNSLMSGGMDELSARAAAARYNLNLEADRYAVALLNVASGSDNQLAGDVELTRLAVDRILREVVGERVACHVFNYNGQVAVLTMLRAEQSMSELLQLMDTAAVVVRDYLGASMTAGVGEPCRELSGIPESAQQAASALNHWVPSDDSQVVYIRDLKLTGGARLTADPQALNKLKSAIRVRSKEEIAFQVRALIDPLRGEKISLAEYQSYMLEALMTVLGVARDMQVELSAAHGSSGSAIQEFLGIRDLEAAGDMLLSMSLEVADAIGAGHRESGVRLARQAQEYIDQRAGEATLTIERVCEELRVSPAFFRTLLKRQTGQTFHQYLTGLRMNRAMEMLKTTSLKTQEVAQKCGLGEASYFSYAFKKHFGVSPSQVRKENG